MAPAVLMVSGDRVLVKAQTSSGRGGLHWTSAEISRLEYHWGAKSLREIATDLGRTLVSVWIKAARLKLGPASRGTTTFAKLAQDTGYARTRLIIAARRLSLHIDRVPRANPRFEQASAKRHHAITEEQAEALISFLSTIPDGKRLHRTDKGAWGGVGRKGKRKPLACVDCARSDRPHYARDRCAVCYGRLPKVTP